MDLSLLQPVSWVAAAIGVCIAAIYYIYNIGATRKTQELALKSQEQNLETRQAQLFMQIYAKLYEPDFLMNLNNAITTEYRSFEEHQRKTSFTENPDEAKKVGPVNLYFEGMGVLVKRKLISPGMVDDLLSGFIISYWEKYRDWVYELRRRYNYPAAGEHIEYLYNEVKKIAAAEHGDQGPIGSGAFGKE